jgi:IS5 family transposase
MLKQITFAQAEYDAKHKTTRRDRFLAEMEILVPWSRLLDQMRPPNYPAAGKGPGRPPLGLELMLRFYFLQHVPLGVPRCNAATRNGKTGKQRNPSLHHPPYSLGR